MLEVNFEFFLNFGKFLFVDFRFVLNRAQKYVYSKRDPYFFSRLGGIY